MNNVGFSLNTNKEFAGNSYITNKKLVFLNK